MATLGELNILIGAEISDFEAKMGAVQSGIGKLGDLAKQAGQGLTTFITLPLGLLAGASLKAAGDIQALEKGFAATYKGSEDLSTALGKVRELAKLPGLGLQEALQGATNLQAAGFSANLATRALGAFGNALATVGKGRADLDGVGLALSQIASKGKISAEEINQLAERVPQIRKVLQDGFGTADAQALQKLGVSATDFVEKVTTELEKLPKVTGGINNAFENLADAGTIALSKLGASINTAFDVEGNLGRLGDFIGEAVASFEKLAPATQKTIFVFAGVAAAIGPVLVAVGALGAALPALVAGFGLLAGPVGLTVAALAGAAVLIVKNWDGIVEYFTTGEGGRVFSDLASAVQDAAATITAVFVQLSSAGTGSFGDLIAAIKPVQFIIRELGDGITGLLDTFTGTIKGITALVKGDFKGALAGGGQAIDGLTRPIRSLFGLIDEKSADFSEFFGLIPAPAKAAAAAIDEVVKAASGLSEDQIKALAALEKKLLDNRNASRALGDSYDYQGNKAKILEAGIVSLTDVGFGPGSKVVQGYVKQLRAVPEALDQIAGRALKGADKLFAVPDFEVKLPKIDKVPDVLSNIVEAPELPNYEKLFGDAAVGVAKGFEKISDARANELDRQRAFNTDYENLIDALASGIGPLVAGFAASFGGALGSVVTGAQSIGDAFVGLFGDILQSIGGFMSTFGQQLITIGIGKLALDSLFSGPQGGPLAIAAGVGLVALAGVVSAVGKSAASSVSNIGRGGAGASLGSTANTPAASTGTRAQELKITAEFVIRGRDLATLAEVDAYRSRRTN